MKVMAILRASIYASRRRPYSTASSNEANLLLASCFAERESEMFTPGIYKQHDPQNARAIGRRMDRLQ